MKRDRIIYYSDPLNDDFAGTNIRTVRVDEHFPYTHRSALWNALSSVLYYVIAVPVVWLISKLWLGLRFKNRDALKKVRGSGFFLYGNHTRTLDPFISALAVFPTKDYIVAGPDAVSLPFLKNIVLMLGAIPIPTGLSGMKKFVSTVSLRCREGNCITLYPEAHIWPFYTGIRDFPDTSFTYPVRENAPVVAMVTTYTRRRGLFRFCRRPGMTVTFSEPMYPDLSLGAKAARAKLRDEVYGFMCRTAQNGENISYITYLPVEFKQDRAKKDANLQ